MKQSKDVLKSFVDKSILDSFVTKQDEYKNATDASAKQAVQDGTFKAWVASLVIWNSDQRKYGSVLEDLVTQFSLGNGQFPKTIQAAADVLQNHKFDQQYFDNVKCKQHD